MCRVSGIGQDKPMQTIRFVSLGGPPVSYVRYRRPSYQPQLRSTSGQLDPWTWPHV